MLAGRPSGRLRLATVVVGGASQVGGRDRLEAEIVAAGTEYDNALRLAVKGLVSDEQLEKFQAERDKTLADLTERLAVLGPALRRWRRFRSMVSCGRRWRT